MWRVYFNPVSPYHANIPSSPLLLALFPPTQLFAVRLEDALAETKLPRELPGYRPPASGFLSPQAYAVAPFSLFEQIVSLVFQPRTFIYD